MWRSVRGGCVEDVWRSVRGGCVEECEGRGFVRVCGGGVCREMWV